MTLCLSSNASHGSLLPLLNCESSVTVRLSGIGPHCVRDILHVNFPYSLPVQPYIICRLARSGIYCRVTICKGDDMASRQGVYDLRACVGICLLIPFS